MSNDTQVAAHMALVDEYAVTAVRRTQGSGGVATLDDSIRARAAVEASARQLAEQGAPNEMVDMTPPATSRDRWMYEQGRLAEREAVCARIKAADDAGAENDYMLDSDDCISVIRGTWKGPMLNDQPRPLAASPTAPSTEASEPVGDKLADRALAKSFRENPREASLADQAGMRRAIADPLTNRAFNMDGCAPTAVEPIQECYGDCPTDPATCANPCNFKGRSAPTSKEQAP